MSDMTANFVGIATGNPISRVLVKIWNGLVYLGESSARARVLQELSEMSDEDLAARGMTREDIIKRVFSDGFSV